MVIVLVLFIHGYDINAYSLPRLLLQCFEIHYRFRITRMRKNTQFYTHAWDMKKSFHS